MLDNISTDILRATTVEYGIGCKQYANTIMELYGEVLRASMEKMAEQLSNSEKIRNYSATKLGWGCNFYKKYSEKNGQNQLSV